MLGQSAHGQEFTLWPDGCRGKLGRTADDQVRNAAHDRLPFWGNWQRRQGNRTFASALKGH